jgi:hypothetical protein
VADQILKLPDDTANTGRKLDASELTVGVQVVERERINIADPADPLGLAAVKNSTPAGTEYGEIVRLAGPIPAGASVIGHVVVDSAGNVSVTSLPSLPAGTNVIGHVIIDSGVVSITGSVAVTGTFWQATQPVSAASLPLPAGAALDASLQPMFKQFSAPALTGFPSTNPISASGDNTVYTPAAGKSIRLKWLYLATLDSNSANVVAKVRFSTQTNAQAFYTAVMGKPGIFSHRTVREGAINDTLIINLSTGQPVYVSFDVEEF